MMNMKDVKDLIDLIEGTDVVEVEVERGGTRIRVRREGAGLPPLPTAVPAVPAAAGGVAAPPVPAPAAATGEAALPENVVLVTAPLVGRFYRAPSPEAPAYVEVGDRVKKGQVLCVIEAMKLMNEIEAEEAGVIRAVLAENGRPVEFGEPLFEIERAG